MEADRIVIVNSPIESGELKFLSANTRDSEALHELLCQIDPGEEYTVSFKKFSPPFLPDNSVKLLIVF